MLHPLPLCVFSLHAFYPSLLNLQLAGQYNVKIVRLFVCGLSSYYPLSSYCFFLFLEDFFAPSPINAPDAALRRAEIPPRRKREGAPCCRSACLSSGWAGHR